MARRRKKPERNRRPAEIRRSKSPGEKRRNPVSAYLLRHLQNFLGTLGRLCRHPVSSFLTISVIGIALALPAAALATYLALGKPGQPDQPFAERAEFLNWVVGYVLEREK